MKSISTCIAVLALVCSGACLSKEASVEMHFYRPDLGPLEFKPVAGTRALRFARILQPVEIGTSLLWRISDTELVPDQANYWARRPDELLDERLRDLLFGAGGFRSSAWAGDPALVVQFAQFEGDLRGKGFASLALIVTLTQEDGVEHRTHVRVEEELAEHSAENLAEAMGRALASAANQIRVWVDEQI